MEKRKFEKLGIETSLLLSLIHISAGSRKGPPQNGADLYAKGAAGSETGQRAAAGVCRATDGGLERRRPCLLYTSRCV